MNPPDAVADERITIDVHLPPGGPLSGMAADVRAGLDQARSRSSPHATSTTSAARELFEEITGLPEYYPTRAERAILERHAAEICAAAGNPATLIELGSGSAAKTRVLLDAMRDGGLPGAYAPVDISEEITRETAEAVASEYGIVVHGLVCDFERDLERMPLAGAARDRASSAARSATSSRRSAPASSPGSRTCSGPSDHFLLGTDLVKDREPPGGRLQRLRGRHRRVQQERPRRAQPRARRRLRPRRVRARRLLGRGEPLDRHPPALPAPPGGPDRPRST